MQHGKPDWAVWLNVPSFTPIEAVALSLDWDPETVDVAYPAFLEPDEFLNRWKIVERNLEPDGALKRLGLPTRPRIRPKEFVRLRWHSGGRFPESPRRGRVAELARGNRPLADA